MKQYLPDFSAEEKLLWGISVALTVIAFRLFDRENHMTLYASAIGITSLLFNAKGNPIGQLLMVIFSLLYGVVSYSFSYYGEMATYLGMTMPIAVFSLISWLKNPYAGNRAQVAANRLSRQEIGWMCAAAVVVTAIFCVILAKLHTANLLPSTISVTTSFLAVYLTFRRSPFFALTYAVNDFILIILWALAAIQDSRYCCVVGCFLAFLVHDIYGYLCWKQMEQQQALSHTKAAI